MLRPGARIEVSEEVRRRLGHKMLGHPNLETKLFVIVLSDYLHESRQSLSPAQAPIRRATSLFARSTSISYPRPLMAANL